jgi:hypothetical protein
MVINIDQSTHHWSTLIDTDRHWSTLIDTDRHWSTLIDTDRHWSTQINTDWHWSTLIDTDRHWSTLIDTDWHWLTLIDTNRQWSTPINSGQLTDHDLSMFMSKFLSTVTPPTIQSRLGLTDPDPFATQIHSEASVRFSKDRDRSEGVSGKSPEG